MPQSLSRILLHVIFSTKDREPWLTPQIRDRAFAYQSQCPSMRLTVRLLPLILLATMGLATAAEDQAPPLTSESVEKLLTTLRTG